MADDKQTLTIGRRIHRLDIQIRRYLDMNLHRSEVARVTGNNGRIISYLMERDGQEVCQRDLEAAFGITRSTASKVVALMERKGLLTRVSVQRDARLKRLQLTERARDLSHMMYRDGMALEQRLLTGFDEDERERLTDYLRRMQQNLSEGEAK